MISVDPGAVLNAATTAATGLTGTLAVQIVNPGERLVFTPRTTVGISEFPAGSGAYGVQLTAPLAPGQYLIIWDWGAGAPITPSNSTIETIDVNFEPFRVYGDDGWWCDGRWGWWWGDDIDGGTPGSNPIPTAADVRGASQLDWDEYGSGLGADPGPGGLQEIVDRAESAFYSITGQKLDSIDVRYAPQVRRVIQAMTEQLAMQGGEDVLDTQSDWDLISSFTAGPYSENHRSPKDMLDGRMLFPVPWVSMALWGLLTPERYSFWWAFFTGQNQPAYETTDVFWSEGQAIGRLYDPYGGWFGGA